MSRFAPLAGGTLKGEARVTADLDGAPSYGALTATLDAQATRLATAYPMLDRVIVGELRLTGALRSTPGGGFGFADLLASGAHGSAKLNGDFGLDKADLNARIDVPQANVLDPRVSGRAQAVGTLTGPLDDLRRHHECDPQRGPPARPQGKRSGAGGRGQRRQRSPRC